MIGRNPRLRVMPGGRLRREVPRSRPTDLRHVAIRYRGVRPTGCVAGRSSMATACRHHGKASRSIMKPLAVQRRGLRCQGRCPTTSNLERLRCDRPHRVSSFGQIVSRRHGPRPRPMPSAIICNHCIDRARHCAGLHRQFWIRATRQAIRACFGHGGTRIKMTEVGENG